MQANVEQINARITFLNDKLGLERQQLWEAIVRQAKVEAWCDIGLAVVGVALAIAGAMVAVRLARYSRKNSTHYGEWPAWGIIGTVICVIAIVGGSVLTLINGYNAAQILPNPVYYAYTHLVY